MQGSYYTRQTIIPSAFLLLWSALVVLTAGAQPRGPLPDSLAERFAYRAHEPIVAVVEVKANGRLIEQTIRFLNDQNKVISAWIIRPADSTGKHPAIVYQHWGYGNKDEFLDEARRMAAKGFVCLSIDAPWLCPDADTSDFLGSFGRICIQGVIDIRCGLDLLCRLPYIDTGRLFYVGHSYGATMGGALITVEKRWHGAVLMAGAYNFNTMVGSGRYKVWNELLKKEPAAMDRMLKGIMGIPAEAYLPYNRLPVLLQFGAQDQDIQRADADRYAGLTAGPRETRYYDAPHRLNEQAKKDRIDWLLRQAGG